MAQQTYEIGNTIYTRDGADRWVCISSYQVLDRPTIYTLLNLNTSEQLIGTADDLSAFREPEMTQDTVDLDPCVVKQELLDDLTRAFRQKAEDSMASKLLAEAWESFLEKMKTGNSEDRDD
jgi:hypothetical protein